MSVLTFAIAASQTGRPLDPAVLELFDPRAAAEVPFPSDRSVTWTNAAGTIWFSGWQARGRANPQELRWHVDPNGLTAFAGRVWRRRDGWSGTASVASALAHHLERQPLVGSADALAGVYVVASLARHGPSAVAADRLGLAPLHWGQSPDVAVLSTRAAVAAALLAAAQGTSPRPRRLHDGLAGLRRADDGSTDGVRADQPRSRRERRGDRTDGGHSAPSIVPTTVAPSRPGAGLRPTRRTGRGACGDDNGDPHSAQEPGHRGMRRPDGR